MGVIADAGYKDAGDMDGLRLRLHAVLARVVTSENLPMMRDPGLESLPRGPPADLAARADI